jgi:hypothetical protein
VLAGRLVAIAFSFFLLWQAFFASCVGANVPALAELPLSACGCRKFQIDPLVTTSALVPPTRVPRRPTTGRLTTSLIQRCGQPHRTTNVVKTQQVARSRGQRCGGIELAGYLANAAGPVPLVLDLRIAHERFGSSSEHSINGHLHYLMM